ncbi:copper homeostasis protein [Catalinimonas alkaloidigena]|uniref:copper homeostasis protein CutC n=1 Tax=Catalinimonas alkaloidigena TaxID=1075417 RepID=UPI002404A5AF|nr:copper homeostasis protein CutC [Catalinimonas alkaloidigena]MDF9797038.1 copper homeostasis protein [Catalinimonas alkaloidigena]
MKIEVCIDSVQSAINAEKGGAVRVELCDNLFEGGTTPSAGAIAIARKQISIGLQVIIRPRGGDFLYSDIEMEIMKHDVQTAKTLGADGVVIGILTPDGKVDKARCAELIAIARPMNVTFHRAFDMTVDPYEALEDVIALGCNRILTSGQQKSAIEGKELIADLHKKANGQIIIMPGAGIDEYNISEMKACGVEECHISARKAEKSGMQYQNHRVFMGGTLRMPEYEVLVADSERINKMTK